MHQGLRHVFDEHATPTHACKRDVHDALQPILSVASLVQRQVSVYRDLMLVAELTEHDPAIDGKFQLMHRTLGSLDKTVSEWIAAGRAVARDINHFERMMAEAKTSIELYEANSGANVTLSGGMSAARAGVVEHRAPDQQAAVEAAFVAGTLPEEDRRATGGGTSAASPAADPG